MLTQVEFLTPTGNRRLAVPAPGRSSKVHDWPGRHAEPGAAAPRLPRRSGMKRSEAGSWRSPRQLMRRRSKRSGRSQMSDFKNVS